MTSATWARVKRRFWNEADSQKDKAADAAFCLFV